MADAECYARCYYLAATEQEYLKSDIKEMCSKTEDVRTITTLNITIPFAINWQKRTKTLAILSLLYGYYCGGRIH
ncbi:hypothetical protein CS542_06845 [Pedobacter sp. IW39]|nr:hypothetical protein CS542_06845 [Pedobacter sp. IW39]